VRDVVWSRAALDDMDALVAYIAADNPTAALKVLDRIDATAGKLHHMPTGRIGRVGGTYEKSVKGLPYIIPYALQTLTRGRQCIVILRVIHDARNWPEDEWPE
jgi:toxin ParE1/3/4